MDYMTLFKEKNIQDSAEYLHNDIGIAKLFYDLHSAVVCYVIEVKTWYTYTGRLWKKDEGGLYVMERCKDFVQALAVYAESPDDGSEVSVAFLKYAKSFHTRRKREGLLSDARSIAPKSLAAFDRNRFLFNCVNGTVNLKSFGLQSHRAEDYITKISKVKYDHEAKCPRWEKFVDEIMCGDTDTAVFLQKALGYALTGDTSLECFFILYGNTTRNGKSMLSETVAYIFGDYARTIQPQTLSRRPSDDTVFSSGRVKLIPFDRHFKPEEQDSDLKKHFGRRDNMSGILNWLIDGYRLMLELWMAVPLRVEAAITIYRQEADIFGAFLDDLTIMEDGNRLPTSVFHAYYMQWAKDNSYRTMMNSKNFVAELHRRCDVRRGWYDEQCHCLLNHPLICSDFNLTLLLQSPSSISF